MKQTIQSELAEDREANMDKQIIAACHELRHFCEQKFGVALPVLIDCLIEMGVVFLPDHLNRELLDSRYIVEQAFNNVAGHETNENLEQS